MKYKLAIFDFDGTLANSFPWFKSIINEIADRLGIRRIEESEEEILRGYSPKQLMKHLGVPLWKLPTIAYHIRTLMTKDIQNISLFEGIDTLLQSLSQEDLVLAIVSSNSYENVQRTLGPENAALIDYYECGVSAFGKTAKLKRVLRKSGMLHHESIYIGDEIRDIKAAQDAGLAFGAVSWGYNSIEALRIYSPQEAFSNVDEILGTLMPSHHPQAD